jgi:hypothetical protein
MTDEEQRAEFRAKLRSLHFGTVPGAYVDSNRTHLSDEGRDQLTAADGEPIFSKERVEDKRSDFRKHRAEYLDAAK